MQISLFNFPPIMGLGLLVAGVLWKPSLVYPRSQRVYIITLGFEYVIDLLLAKKISLSWDSASLFFFWSCQSLSHPASMAMLQVWSLVGRWHSQCGVSSPKIDSRTPTNVNHQYLTVYSRLSGMVLDICRGLVLCFRLNPEAIIANAERQLSNRRQKALLKF